VSSDYVLPATAVAFVILFSAVLFFFIARRLLRLAIKAAFALAIILGVLMTVGAGWWRGWFDTSSRTTHPAQPTNKRINSNGRSQR